MFRFVSRSRQAGRTLASVSRTRRVRLPALLALLLCLALSGQALAIPSDSLPEDARAEGAEDVIALPGGGFLVAGRVEVKHTYGYDMLLRKYNADGSEDAGFGSGGWMRIDFDDLSDVYPDYEEGYDDAVALLAQPDGKIVVVGSSDDRFALARLNPDFSLDTSFGNGGQLTTTFTWSAAATSAALQPDGKIVVGGYNYGDSYTNYLALARYNPDGSLDGSFGQGGLVTLNETVEPLWGRIESLTLQPDGKIFMAGSTVTYSPTNAASTFTVGRFNADGSVDDSYGVTTAGFTVVPVGPHSGAVGAALQPDGRVIAGGWTCSLEVEQCNALLIAFQPNGDVDHGFADDGAVFTDLGNTNEEIFAMATTESGKIVLAGKHDLDTLVLRYNPDGSLDTSAVIPHGDFASIEAHGLVASDGPILWVGNGPQLYAGGFDSYTPTEIVLGVAGEHSVSNDRRRGAQGCSPVCPVAPSAPTSRSRAH